MTRVNFLSSYPDLNRPENPKFHKRPRRVPKTGGIGRSDHHRSFPHCRSSGLPIYLRAAARRGLRYQATSTAPKTSREEIREAMLRWPIVSQQGIPSSKTAPRPLRHRPPDPGTHRLRIAFDDPALTI